jgi:hypothetical protein
MMEKVLASKSDIIHTKSLSVNNMLQLPLMLYSTRIDTDNVLLKYCPVWKILQIKTPE